MRTKSASLAAMAAALLAATFAAGAQATTVNIAADGNWHQFDIDDLYAQSGGVEWIDAIDDDLGPYNNDGSALTFALTLTQTSTLTVVDAGFAGDEFRITINGQDYLSSTASNTYPDSIGTDFDAALTDSRYSYLNVVLGAGTYFISGDLATSALDDTDLPLNATVGGLRVTEVPVPAAAWLFGSALVAGLGAMRRPRS
jgi:hypothetical protein